MDGWLGLRGWHLLFIIEGLPAVLLGIAAWFILRDRPHQANWLSSEQKFLLTAEPVRLMRTIAKNKPGGNAQQHGG